MNNENLLKISALIVAFLIAFSSGFADNQKSTQDNFTFVQISDSHWGFNDPKVNPDFAGTLQKTIQDVNNLAIQPDFVIFTGDLTHTTDDPKIRRQRMADFKIIVSRLKVTNVMFIPGEHDAGLDNGQAFKENFGETHYAFDHKGVHFIALDNVSDPAAKIGDQQLEWLGNILKKFDKDSRIVILTHRPLFDLMPKWDWATQDGAKALELLKPFKNVTVLYGHIHQNNNHQEGSVNLYAAKGTMYPLPAPGSVPKKAPVQWDPGQPYKGLGFRTVEFKSAQSTPVITEYPIVKNQAAMMPESTIKITAKRYEFSPKEIHIKTGIPATLELTSLDRLHGFYIPDLKIRTNIEPGKSTLLKITVDKAGTYDFSCDIFCGEGHENMSGVIIVE